MLKKFINYTKNKTEGLVVLQTTTLITQKHLKMEKWKELKKLYTFADKDSVKIVSVINAILTHNRELVALQRDRLLNLIRNDLNIPKKYQPTGIANNKYAEIRKALQDNNTGLGVLKLYRKGSGKKGSLDIFEVTEEYRKHISSVTSREDQLIEIQRFNDSSSDEVTDKGSSTKLSDKSIMNSGSSNQNIGFSNMETEKRSPWKERRLQNIAIKNNDKLNEYLSVSFGLGLIKNVDELDSIFSDICWNKLFKEYKSKKDIDVQSLDQFGHYFKISKLNSDSVLELAEKIKWYLTNNFSETDFVDCVQSKVSSILNQTDSDL